MLALNTRQFVSVLLIGIVALLILSIIMLYTVAHVDVLHMILSSIRPNATYPHGSIDPNATYPHG